MDAGQAAKSQSHHRVREGDVHTRVRQSVRGSTAAPRVQKWLWVVYLAMQCLEKFMVQWLAMTWGLPSQLNVQSCVQRCEAGDKHPGYSPLTGNGQKLARKLRFSFVVTCAFSIRTLALLTTLNITSLKHCHARCCMSCSSPICISCDRPVFMPKGTLFCHKHTSAVTQKLLSRLLSIQLRESALRESCSFQYLLKCYQNHSERLAAINAVYGLCAAEAGLPALATIVCLHAIHPYPSEEEMAESHLHNSSPKGAARLRLHADWLQCVLIDRAHILHTREECGNTEEGRERCVPETASPAGFLCIPNNVIICQYHQSSFKLRNSTLPEDVPLAIQMITVPVFKDTTCRQTVILIAIKKYRGIINDEWKSNPLGDGVHGKRKQEHLVARVAPSALRPR